MKTHNMTEIVALCTVMLIVTLAGCLSSNQAAEIRDAAHTAILEYVETQGQWRRRSNTSTSWSRRAGSAPGKCGENQSGDPAWD